MQQPTQNTIRCAVPGCGAGRTVAPLPLCAEYTALQALRERVIAGHASEYPTKPAHLPERQQFSHYPGGVQRQARLVALCAWELWH